MSHVVGQGFKLAIRSPSVNWEAMKSVLGSLTSLRKYGVPLQDGMRCMSPNMNANLYYFFILFWILKFLFGFRKICFLKLSGQSNPNFTGPIGQVGATQVGGFPQLTFLNSEPR